MTADYREVAMEKFPEAWVGQPGKVQETTMSITLSHGLRDTIRASAEEEGVSASYWMRRAAVAALERDYAKAAAVAE